MTPFQGRTLRQAAWLGCLACLACLPSSLTLRTSLVGEWSTSPQDCSEERRPTLHFTENTVSATLETYENCEDGELLWTIHHFGPYYKHSDSDRKMVYDGSRETQDAEAFYFGQSTHQLIPNSVQGAAVLTTKIMSATQEECPDKDALLPLSAHAPRDITYLRCPLLGFQPVYNCTTTHRLLYVDDTDRLWVSGVGNGDKLYAACDKAVLDTATFATAPLKKVLDAPSLRGDWNLACQSVQPAAGQHSFTAQFTIAPPYYSLKMQIYSGGSCEDANLIMEDHDFGSLEIGARHPAENSFFELEVAGLQRFLVAPTDASVAKSNDLITGSTDCEHEIGTFKNGDFKPVQFASCEALCLRPEARRGVLTTGVKVEGTTMTMMWDTNALPTCGLSGTSGRAAFTKMSASDVDFGLGVPAYPFTPGAQNGWNTAFFFMAFGEALGFTPTDDKWAFMDSLLTMDFQMIVRGNWNFNPVVGTYAQLHEPCDDGHCRVGPIKRYLEAFNRSYEYIGTQNFRFEAFTPNTAVLSFESLIKSKHTTQDSGPVATVWIMRFNQGLLSTLDVHTDTMPYAEANCPSIVNCGLVGEARITKSSQNTIQNSTSINNKYPGTADPDSNITATNALIFILTIVVLVCLGYATRLVYKLRAGSTLQEIDLAVRR